MTPLAYKYGCVWTHLYKRGTRLLSNEKSTFVKCRSSQKAPIRFRRPQAAQSTIFAAFLQKVDTLRGPFVFFPTETMLFGQQKL